MIVSMERSAAVMRFSSFPIRWSHTNPRNRYSLSTQVAQRRLLHGGAFTIPPPLLLSARFDIIRVGESRKVETTWMQGMSQRNLKTQVPVNYDTTMREYRNRQRKSEGRKNENKPIPC